MSNPLKDSVSSTEEARARKYSQLKYSLALFDIAYSALLLLLFLQLGLSRALSLWLSAINPNQFFLVPAYLAITLTGASLLYLPLHYYQSFRLEHIFGLSNQNLSSWIKDELKGLILSYLLSLVVAGAFLYLVRTFLSNWWLVMGAFWIIFSIILARLVPVIVIPIFFKYKKLKDESLRARIMGIAEKMNVSVMDCYEIDLSKKTVKANAALTGIGKSRRVILSDTLKDKYTDDEIEVILAHEFAHYKFRHIWKLLLFNSAITLFTFFMMSVTGESVLRIFGLRSFWDVAALPMAALYFQIIGLVFMPAGNALSRVFEHSADRAAVAITQKPQAFVSLMEKLSLQNLSDKNPPWIVKVIFYDHPPIAERILKIKTA